MRRGRALDIDRGDLQRLGLPNAALRDRQADLNAEILLIAEP